MKTTITRNIRIQTQDTAVQGPGIILEFLAGQSQISPGESQDK